MAFSKYGSEKYGGSFRGKNFKKVDRSKWNDIFKMNIRETGREMYGLDSFGSRLILVTSCKHDIELICCKFNS